MPESEACERKRQLLQDLLQVLSRVSHVGGSGSEITRPSAANEQSEQSAVLQHAVNEQQQALRALEEHQEEHGC